MKKIYSVRDNKVDAYGVPFFVDSDVQALRELHVAVNDNRIQLSIFPEDFDLYELGSFNEQTGKIDTLVVPKFITGAVSLKKQINMEVKSELEDKILPARKE
jgi:hypothetical protein